MIGSLGTGWEKGPSASNSTTEGSVQSLSFEGRTTEWKTTGVGSRRGLPGGGRLKERVKKTESVSSVENPGWLFDIGDYTTQLYVDYFISHFFGIPSLTNQYFMECQQGFHHCSCAFLGWWVKTWPELKAWNRDCLTAEINRSRIESLEGLKYSTVAFHSLHALLHSLPPKNTSCWWFVVKMDTVSLMKGLVVPWTQCFLIISFGPRILGMSWGYNSIYRGYNPSYPFIRPFLGVITAFITRLGADHVSKTFVLRPFAWCHARRVWVFQ